MDALARRAYARAAPDLVAEASATTLGIEAERLQAKTVIVGQRAQREERGTPRAVHAVDERQRLGVDLGRRREPQPLAVEDEPAGRFRPAQRAVVGRRELLHE